jgi:hypothetical protein
VDPDVALGEVALRFAAANGPVTRVDLARWWGTTPARAGKLVAIHEQLVELDVEGTPGWMPSAEVDEAAGAGPARSVRLLPAFDQFVVGATRHADHVLPGALAKRVYRDQGWLSPVVLVNGRMDGVWRHERRGRQVTVEVEPFVDLPAWARRGVEQEADRLAAFLGGPLDLRWT